MSSTRRDTQVRRPRRWTPRALGAIGLIFVMSALLMSSAFAVNYYNLTFAGATATDGSAVFIQGGTGAGTGQFDPFLTLGANDGNEKGYNTTDASAEFDTSTSADRTHPIQAAAIPPTIYNGVSYREFSLDANDTGSDDWMSIDAIRIYLDDQNNLTGYTKTGAGTFSSDTAPFATLIYDLNGVILMRSQTLTPGSGVSDITVLIPDALFPANCFYGSTTCDLWVYFYTEHGYLGVADPGVTPNPTGSQNWDVTGGFEEWRTRLLPVVNVTKTVNLTQTRTFDWTLVKEVSIDDGATWQSADSVDLFKGQSQDYKWKLTWTKNAGTISSPQISGTITVTNPTGGTVISTSIDAVVNGVTDTLVMGATTHPATVCSVTFPHTLKAGESFTCTYTAAGSTTDGTNTATATVENGVTDLTYSSAAMPVVWANATTTDVDGTASINDPNFTAANQTGLTANGSFTSTTENYPCGSTTTITNTATLTESTSGQTRVSSASLTVNCYGLTVDKTVNTAFTRTYDWTLLKQVSIDGGTTWQSADTVHLFLGQSQDYLWKLTWTKDAGTDSGWVVSGTITVTNPAPIGATGVSVTDALSISGAATFSCPGSTIAANGGTLVCTYTKTIGAATGQTNTATATMFSQNYSSTAKTVAFSSTPTTVVDNSASIDDPNFPGANQTGLTANGSFTSTTQTYTCGSSTTITNTGTLTESDSGQTRVSSASLTVDCNTITVTKDAFTSLTRTYHWTISKTSSDGAALTLDPNETFDYHYSVTVGLDTTTPFTDSDWAVTGNIHVNNPASVAATLASVTDSIFGVGAAPVSCGVTFPYSLAAGATLDCTYSSDLPDATTRLNTATATIGTTGVTGTASVSFASPTINKVDECITVTDTLQGALGTVCFGVDTLPKTFNYIRTYGPFGADCGDHVIPNTATFTTTDLGNTGSSTWTLTITIPCPTGCTLTQGYWKTHSIYGPAKTADATWNAPSGSVWDTGFNQDSTFYLSTQTYIQVMKTSPKGGNVYYILAHQYIAALLNIRAGAATTPAVVAALDYAQGFFLTYTPTSVFTKAIKSDAIGAAGTLGSYNEGLIGPGHCSEDTTGTTANRD